MTDITLTNTITVTLEHTLGSDLGIAQSAWVSTDRAGSPDEIAGLINYLMKHRHGTPFEDGHFKFTIHAPIFVAREHMRHRIGWSYSELSARYSELEPTFWAPGPERGIVNTGSSARPKMGPASKPQYDTVMQETLFAYRAAWTAYQGMLRTGIAREVARTVLPVGIYTRYVARCNPRSLMHFLSLRTHDQDARFLSYPQAEIELAARAMEEHFAEWFPVTHAAFVTHGRVSP